MKQDAKEDGDCKIISHETGSILVIAIFFSISNSLFTKVSNQSGSYDRKLNLPNIAYLVILVYLVEITFYHSNFIVMSNIISLV